MPDRISASTCNPTIMSCVDEAALESRVDASPTAQPPGDNQDVGRQASSRGAASTLWTQGACKTVVSNSVKAVGDTALAIGIGASAASKIPAPALYGVAAKFITAVAADSVAALSCEP